MKLFNDIQTKIDDAFQAFIEKVLRSNELEKLKYFYWSASFFENVGGLSFQYFQLSQTQKDRINAIGESYFESEDVFFEVNKNSHRHDIKINNINKLLLNHQGVQDKQIDMNTSKNTFYTIFLKNYLILINHQYLKR